ncbi:uncharacterized protein LOC111718059 [Eurytemora carolleeae]|uniref:uncharacterized protein LOC111718059 n=1 Tax=Eurytemora carolleeae TaxID=1294199 RepID=UPI000C78D32C|nr:uncharacterized protein LOC111718059 [Eurytemora carolleeae]|eukprot:XP_023349319.1 uncharacterized protein LOC111718059 [Eurytemora affinis]
MADDALPSPNFDKKPEGFIQFSSTPVHGNPFKPKWGKKNRQDNWTRFGKSENHEINNSRSPGWSQEAGSPNQNHGNQNQGYGNQNQGYGNQNQGYGNQNQGYGNQNRGYGNHGTNQSYGNLSSGNEGFRHNSPRGGGFGSPCRGGSSPSNRGGYGYGSPSPRGGGGGYSPRGGLRGQNSNQWNNSPRQQFNGNSNSNSFFHPSMVEDPWRELEQRRKLRLDQSQSTMDESRSSRDESGVSKDDFHPLSESMIPQVGDSLLQRNYALEDSQLIPDSREDNNV